jgi:hypothetical protein
MSELSEREIRFYAVTPGGDMETLRGDVHHLLNPLIGHLRMVADGFDPAAVPLDPRVAVELPDGVPQSVLIDQAELVALVQRLMVVTDLCDAALGERPMREQLAALSATQHATPAPVVPPTTGRDAEA